MRAALALLVALTAPPATAQDRVLSLGRSVTEIVDALGQSGRLVGRDSTSTHPSAVTDLPDMGYVRALSPEGVLSVEPDLILAEEGAGPPETLAILRSAEIPLVLIPEGYDRAGLRVRIMAVGAAVGGTEAAEALADRTDARLARAVQDAKGTAPPRAMFVLSMRGGRVMASGAGTAADAILRLAGAQNAVAGFKGYKQMTDEVVAAADPDVIVMMTLGGDHSAEDDAIATHPAFATTPAAAKRAIVRLDGLLLLGFGPRTPDAVEALSAAMAAAMAAAPSSASPTDG